MTTHGDDDPTRLQTWLADRRWYGEKARALSGVERVFHTEVSVNGGHVIIEVQRLRFADGEPAEYLLITDPASPDEDGIESDRVRQWLIRQFSGERTIDGEGGSLVVRAEQMDTVLASLAGQPSRVFRGEQSNSSIVYGNGAMLKLFRKLREGVNPEVEIGRFLTRETPFTAFPRLFGTIELERDGAATTAGALQEFIPSVGDAWSWVTERVVDDAVRSATVDAARQLGVRTGELHRALAMGTEAAFAPEQATADLARTVHADAVAELEQTVSALNRGGVDDADALGDALRASLAAFDRLEGTMVTRIHGDYHLGQVLRTASSDFAILDFEGEPSRTLEERRAKASPLRDVAGMLRSFDYAAETARRADGADVAAIDAWHDAARAAFMSGYDAATVDDEVLQHGWTADARRAVLAAFEVHKALYEARYELDNRPDWLAIPLNALRRIARHGTA